MIQPHDAFDWFRPTGDPTVLGGLELGALLDRAGIDQATAALSSDQHFLLMLSSIDLTDDECHGLGDRPLRPGFSEVGLRAMMGAGSLETALRVLSRFYALSSQVFALEVRTGDGLARIALRAEGRDRARAAMLEEIWLMALSMFMNWFVGRDLPIVSMTVSRRDHPDVGGLHWAFGAPVAWAAALRRRRSRSRRQFPLPARPPRGDSAMTKSDPARHAEAYARDGFVAVEGLLDATEIEDLKAEAFDIATGRRGPVAGAKPQGDRTLDEVNADVLAIQFPHKISPTMRAAMHHPRIVEILTRLIGPDVKAMQSILFVKAAGQPGQAWHQDEHFIPTRDRSLCGVWIALDDATVENGCLWFQPGSQGPGVLWPMRPHDDPRFDLSEQAYGHPFDPEAGVAAEVKAGAVVFFNGYVLHRSLPNHAAGRFRRALVTHYMNARSLLPWSLGQPPVPRADYRDIEMVAGEDPYAWKGLCSISHAFVRRTEDA